MANNQIQMFQQQIADSLLLDRRQVFLYWKGRVALYALLKAMGVQPGDEVILPAYTCVVVPNAIMYLGAKPVYVDISAESYTMDVALVEDAITDKTRVILCQNTYGLSANLEALIDIAKRHGLYTIEDCAHGYGGSYNGQPNGLQCDAAFFSTQWNKPFSSGVGGFAVTQDKKLAAHLDMLEKEKVMPSWKDVSMLRLLFLVRRFLLNEVTYWSLVELYRWLSKHNLILGSSNGVELVKPEIPENFFKGFSGVQAVEGMRTSQHLSDRLLERKENARAYSRFLSQHRKSYVSDTWFDNHSFLKYPLLVRNRKKFLEKAKDAKVHLGEWFNSPLHPIQGDLSPWMFDRDQFPVAGQKAEQMINLPTTPKSRDKILAFIEQNIDQIL